MNRLLGWLRIALIDLRGDARRFIILLACLALGVGTIAAVSSVGAALQGAVDRDARVILGGDLEVRSRGADISAEQRSAVEALGQTARIVDVSARASANDKSLLLSLRAASQAYPLAGTVILGPETGTRPLRSLTVSTDDLPGVVVDPGVLQRLGVTLGDVIRIGNADFIIRATLLALPDQAMQGFQLGLPAIISDDELAEAGLDQPGVLSRYSYKVVLAKGTAAGAIAKLAEAYPDSDWDLRQPADAAANLKRFFDLFARFLTLVGLSSLLVGGVGVSNAVSAYITERQTSIATLRSLGATSARIAVHFLTQILVLTMIGVFLGLALGATTSLLALPVLSGMLAIDLQPSVDPTSLLTAAGFGLLIGFAFALLPLRGAQKLKPASLFRSAGGMEARTGFRDLVQWQTSLPLLAALLAIGGLAILTTGAPWLVLWYAVGAIAAFGLLRLAAWLLQRVLRLLPPLPNATLRQAIKAIHRPGAAAPAVVLSLGLGLALLLMITLLDQNLRTQIDGAIADDAPAFVLLDMPKDQVPLVQAFAAADPGIETLATIPMLRGTIETIKSVPVSELPKLPDDLADTFEGDTAISWAKSLPAGSTVVDGEFWVEDYSGPPLVSLSEEFRAPLDLSLGDEITIAVAGRPLMATITSFRAIDWREGGLNFRLLFSPGIIEAAPQTVMGTIDVVGGAAPEVESRLSAAFPTLTFLPVGEALERIAGILSSLANAVALVGSLAVVSGILVLAGAMTVGRRQREADAVVMKVLGARRGDVVSAFIVEYGLLGLLAAIVGAGLGMSASWAILTFVMDIPFQPNLMVVALVVIGTVVATIATGVLTTWSAMSVRPARQLRGENT